MLKTTIKKIKMYQKVKGSEAISQFATFGIAEVQGILILLHHMHGVHTPLCCCVEDAGCHDVHQCSAFSKMLPLPTSSQ
jgi:hypothetical protein